jgi:hypothetical protein
MAMTDVVELELAQHATSDAAPVVIVDDAEDLDATGRAALRRASKAGAHLVVVAPSENVSDLTMAPPVRFVVDPLDAEAAAELVHRSVPSLPDALRTHLVERVGGRPGVLRAAVRRLAGRPIVSREDVDAALGNDVPSPASSAGTLKGLDQAERALDTGRFDEAA